MHVEHEYFRMGAWTYLAAWDVHRARLFGRCEVKSGIAPVDRLVGEVRGQELINLLAASFGSWQELQQCLLAFQAYYERSASPFNWTFTRRDLNALLAKIDLKRLAPAA